MNPGGLRAQMRNFATLGCLWDWSQADLLWACQPAAPTGWSGLLADAASLNANMLANPDTNEHERQCSACAAPNRTMCACTSFRPPLTGIGQALPGASRTAYPSCGRLSAHSNPPLKWTSRRLAAAGNEWRASANASRSSLGGHGHDAGPPVASRLPGCSPFAAAKRRRKSVRLRQPSWWQVCLFAPACHMSRAYDGGINRKLDAPRWVCWLPWLRKKRKADAQNQIRETQNYNAASSKLLNSS